MQHIEGWMMASVIFVLGFLAQLVDSRRQFTEKIQSNRKSIERQADALDEHEESPVAHPRVLVADTQCAERMGGVRDGLAEVKTAVQAVHKRLDTIKNGRT